MFICRPKKIACGRQAQILSISHSKIDTRCWPSFSIARVNPDNSGCVWTGNFHLNTLRVDGESFESGEKKNADLNILGYLWT